MIATRDVISCLLLLSRKGRHSPYVSAMLLNMCHLIYWRINDLPSWHLFYQNATLINEEPGEISLSVLSKVVVSDTHKDSHELQNTAYSMLRLYHQISNGFEEEIDIVKNFKHKTYITHKSPEVKLLSKWIFQQFMNMLLNLWVTYLPMSDYPRLEECKKKRPFKTGSNLTANMDRQH